MMRRSLAVISAVVSTVGLLQVASAADMARKAPIAPPPPPPVATWTGCYVGLNAGGVWGRLHDDWTANPTGFGGPAFISANGSSRIEASGFTGGGQIGCNKQIDPF